MGTKKSFRVIGEKMVGAYMKWALLDDSNSVIHVDFHQPFKNLYKRNSLFPCIETIENHKRVISIDWEGIYSSLYEVGKIYDFRVVTLELDDNSYKRQLIVADRFGFRYILEKPSKEDCKETQTSISCHVEAINSYGLVLSSTTGGEKENIKLKKEQEALFDKLHRERKKAFTMFNKRAYRGVWHSVIDKYPDTAHFIYELLQNADDALATEVTILLSRESLIFKHNGSVRFTVTDPDNETITPGHINSIVAIGDSTKKDDDTTNKIGKFGIGFKSVFQYTACPEIYDDYFKFKIENFIVPVRLKEDHPKRDTGETLFVIPFKNPDAAYKEISSKLKVLANCTLFLHNLHHIRWRNLQTKEHKHFSKEITETFVSNRRITMEKLVISDYETTKNLLMFSRTVDVGDDRKHKIYVGYYVHKDGSINTKERPKVHCFFPTSETFNTCMIVHAPFLLVDNRQQIKPGEEVNEILIKEIGILAADTLCEIRDLGEREDKVLLNENIKDIINWDEYRYYAYSFYSYQDHSQIGINEIIKPCLEKMKNAKLLLSKSGTYYKATQIYQIRPQALSELINTTQLRSLTDSKNEVGILSPALNRIDFSNVEEEVGIKTYTTYEFAIDVTPKFMKSQQISWIEKMFYFLLNEARGTWNPDEKNPYFLTAPIIETTKGEWVPPFEDGHINVFSGGDANQYNVISKSMVASKPIMKFLNELGCKEPDLLDHIFANVLTKYQDDDKEHDEEDLLADFKLVLKYYKDASSDSRDTLVEKLKESLWICCTNAKGQEYALLAKEMFLDTDDLKRYFQGMKSIKFFDTKFYQGVIKEFGRNLVNEFLEELGIQLLPQIEKKQIIGLYALSNNQRSQIGNIYSTQTPETTDYQIQGLANALSGAVSKADTQNIWRLLTELSIDTYKKARCRLFYRTAFYKYCDSSIVETLRSYSWICIKNKMVKPQDTCIEELISEKYNINYELCEIIGIQKKSIDLAEAGASEEQIENERMGALMRKYGLDEKDLAEKAAEKKQQQRKNEQKAKEKKNDFPIEQKQDLRNTGDESFVNTNNAPKTSTKTGTTKTTAEDRAEKIREAQEKALNEISRNEKLEELRASVQEMEKYSKEWFEALLELEYKNDTPIQSRGTSKAISLKFGKVIPDTVSERIYILKNPSGTIPMEIETIERLEVHFEFMDREDLNIVFEVASVRDFTLRIKAKASDSIMLSKIDWKKCTKATVNANNPTELMGKLITAFQNLGVDDGFNFKKNLGDNISFVFGPPGTGKTTYLANQICQLINNEDYCKILVLTPTNKACDVITEKIADMASEPQWLGRFVATGSDRIENSSLLCSRDSDIDEQDKCCLVSTIARLPYDGFQRLGGAPKLRDIDWNYVIIDEASMIPLAQIIYAIYQFSPYAKVIIAGDPLQIPPICKEEIWKDENIYTMVKLNRFDRPITEPRQFDITNLSTQYRSVPAIGKIFSKYAYNDKLSHHRTEDDIREVSIDGLPLKPINFIQFKVDKYDNIYGPKKLSGSNVQIYSVLLINEICRFVSQKYSDEQKLNIGIICPYVAESQMIERLIEQIEDIPENISFSVGTIHGFQGDECDMVFVVFNPPKGTTTHPDKIMLNKQHIINVAVSRAKDYLFMLIPHKDMVGYENLCEINKIGRIVVDNCKGQYQFFTCDQIEKIIFGQSKFLEENTFVTSHQMSNVYTEAGMKYEVRIDENSVDIQISDN